MIRYRPKETARLLGAAAVNLVLGANLRSAGLIRRPRSLVDYASEALFLYGTIGDARGIRQRSVLDLFNVAKPNEITLAKADEPVWSWRASYQVDLVSLCLLCRITQPRIVFEIGTLRGFTSWHFALNTPESTKVYTLDMPSEGTEPPLLNVTTMDIIHIDSSRASATCWFDGTPEGSRVFRLFGDSARFDFSPYHGMVDLFFIDGSHSYEYVRSDTDNALKCCHTGSIIAWHDFGRAGVNGVSRFLRIMARDYPIYSVPGGSLAYMQYP